jgi:hypothetical protein
MLLASHVTTGQKRRSQTGKKKVKSKQTEEKNNAWENGCYLLDR